MELLLKEHIVPNATTIMAWGSDEYRRTVLYTEDLERLLQVPCSSRHIV